ncbi:hypothetical protein I8748_19590 [Nostoc sp. CENA67]|uniref:Uncharacterized protein n=1 Tax=Amazonocrinis nigriterrae CENA67 TaxID=2794033 RepID=A0A8J7HW47_9NOST|nr:hypothetical protein [Amazonocrinis nigriterrae]MBH8564362.1 hypothetical protein [Amazonocrinis nigriterrae CENA67]
MEPLQKQILTLSDKLDALYQVIEELDGKVAQAFSECSLANSQAKDNYLENNDTGRFQLKAQSNINPELEHKDVLTDGIYLDMNRQGGDKNITPEIQIQRLTAQLTAAYNRIAALEEQLLRERIH